MDEETLEALLAGSDAEASELDEDDHADGERSDLEDLEGRSSKLCSVVQFSMSVLHIAYLCSNDCAY